MSDSNQHVVQTCNFPPILTTEQVAEMTCLDRGWFDRARVGGYGPPFMRVTSRIIRYDRDEVLAWFREHRVSS